MGPPPLFSKAVTQEFLSSHVVFYPGSGVIAERGDERRVGEKLTYEEEQIERFHGVAELENHFTALCASKAFLRLPASEAALPLPQ